VIFLLFLPGYFLLGVFFPRRNDLDGLERLGLGIGVSIAVTASITAVLNYLPCGIQFGSVVTSVGLFILLTGCAIWYRLNKLSPKDRFVRLETKLAGLGQLSVLNMFGFIVLLTLLVTAFGIGTYLGTSPEFGETFTQFYILGPTGKANDYPTEITVDQPIAIWMGVVNHEHKTVRYRIEQQVTGEVNLPIATFQLGHGEKWEQPYVFTLTRPEKSQRVTFLLYKWDEWQPYRSLHLWITVEQQP
jgi:uncharacterized membrane protein